MPRTIPAVHIHIEGHTAFFRYTGIISGNQLTLPCPTYANLLGLISACAGRTICPRDTRIGYEFNHASEDEDLERTNRLEYRGKAGLRPHAEGQGVVRRQVHFRPRLDLYLTNLALEEAFRNPVVTPCLGRSQDMCWITKVEQVDMEPVNSGRIGATMIGRRDRVLDPSIPSDIVICTEWFTNDQTGFTRMVRSSGYYQVIEPDEGRVGVSIDDLYQPSNLPKGEVIYLHEWTEPVLRVSRQRKPRNKG